MEPEEKLKLLKDKRKRLGEIQEEADTIATRMSELKEEAESIWEEVKDLK